MCIRDRRLRDAVEFTPFLIINGEPAKMEGNGGWGTAPRTAIGQRRDGTVVFVVVDGRSISSAGVSIRTLQEIMVEQQCYNACLLYTSLILNDTALHRSAVSLVCSKKRQLFPRLFLHLFNCAANLFGKIGYKTCHT